MRIYLERKFDAAHMLGNKQKPECWNQDTYGKCCCLHGHTWRVEVTIEGVTNPDNGMVVNFNSVKKVIDDLDHGFVNDKLALPTAENLVTYFLDKIAEIDSFDTVKVRVWESPTAYAEDYRIKM